MRLPLSWLRDYVDITIPPEEVAEKLTLAGLEVEQMEYVGIPRPEGLRMGRGERPELAWDPTRVFVGHILEVKPHPNADRLTLAIVDYGRSAPIQVVTGAPNLKVGDSGQKVAFGVEGARLFDGHEAGWKPMTLKKGKIRGIESGSMVLSEKELGISEDHEGIIILPDDAPIGEPLVEYLGDIVFEVKINPNMARCASVLGVAREVAAITNSQLHPPSLDVVAQGASIKGQVDILIQEPRLNPRFTAALLRDTEIKPSPFLMQHRLKLAGMRPINNIVDVTNYVMLEVGQPLHAFDYDKLYARAGHRPPTIITRLAEPGEELETLDGLKRKLDPFTILVCDTRGSLSIGGVMGGAESEVDANSKNILLEAAAWDYINIRRTMAAQHLASEAGYRFSRGVAPSQAIVGLKCAIELMRQVGGGEIARGVIDTYPGKPKKIVINLPIAEVKRQLGVEIAPKQITKILESLDFQVKSQKSKVKSKSSNLQSPISNLQITVPDYRLDVDGADDLIEEIARLYGYANIPISRMNDELPPQWTNVDLEQEEQVRDVLVNAGLQEVISYALTTPEREALLGATHLPSASHVRIGNPISPERTVMRQTLLANLLDLAAANLRYQTRVALFEVGNVYRRRSADEPLLPRELATALPEDKELPVERRRLSIVLTGPGGTISWTKTDTALMDFFDLKGVLEELLEGLHLSGASFVAAENALYHPGRAAALVLDSQEIGVFGELHPLLREKFDLPAQPVLLGEFDLDALLAPVSPLFATRALSRYPVVTQDLAIIVDENVDADRVYALIRQTGGELLQRAALFDLYRGEPIPAGKKSLAYTLTFQAMDRTLSEQDATKIRDKIVNRLRHELGAELRGV
ncbi:MAG: phenylalanine--tRNA ligase subunit beta [Chloroflexi bacterium]|nr:phenylalanine--tRNA ligase subunit beta [Chloroflexota bacterium]